MSSHRRSALLETFDVLVGRWETEALVDGRSRGRGTATFEWVEEGAFLRVRADSVDGEPDWMAAAPASSTSYIGLDDTHQAFTVLYSDARDVFRVYRTSLVDGVWRQWREAPGFDQRFTGLLDGERIVGFWETSEDTRTWSKDFDLVYRRT
jgi:hypothetical protein